MGIGKLLSDRISAYLQTVTASSAGTTAQRLKWFREFLEREVDGDLSRVTIDVADAYIAYLLTERHLARTSARCYFAAARMFWQWCWRTNNAMATLFQCCAKIKAKPNFKAEPLSTEELETFLQAEDLIEWRALWEIYAATGARCAEILHLRHRDLDLKEGKFRCVVKGGEERELTLDLHSLKHLIAYIGTGEHDPEAPVWPGRGPGGHPSKKQATKFLSKQAVCNRLHKIAERAGFEPGRMRTHLFRHTFATDLLDMTQNLDAVREALGHKHVDTTQGYVRTKKAVVRDLVHQRAEQRAAQRLGATGS